MHPTRAIHRLVLVVLAGVGLPVASVAQSQWPLEPVHQEHPVGTTLGEFRKSVAGPYYFHEGIDVLGEPARATGFTPAGTPFVTVVVAGTVKDLNDSSPGTDNYVVVAGNDGLEYGYRHLAWDNSQPEIRDAFELGGPIASGQRIAWIAAWPDCGFDHVHYDILDPVAGVWRNPLAVPGVPAQAGQVSPNPDGFAPEIEWIWFAKDDEANGRWCELQWTPGGCTHVAGDVDIVVGIRDEDAAGSPHPGARSVGVHRVQWRFHPDDALPGAWIDTHPFDEMPGAWGVANQNPPAEELFSTKAPWESEFSYCSAATTYMVVTNFVPGVAGPTKVGAWNTLALPDGGCTIEVEVTDFTGLTTQGSVKVCIGNQRSCLPELTIRDGEGDRGAIPYRGDPSWLSPDILVNPGTPQEDREILLNHPNEVRVRVWNFGCGDLPEGTQCKVGLGWGPPGPLLPASGDVVDTTLTAPAGGWKVGSPEWVKFHWTPGGAAPPGHACLKAWVTMPDDPMNSQSWVVWDDNKAQRNLTFVEPPPAAPPGTAPASSPAPAAEVWIQPIEGVSERSLEVRVQPTSGLRGGLREVRLHVPPTLLVESVEGSSVIGGYQGARPEDGRLDPSSPCAAASLSWEDARSRGCTRVLGDIPPGGRLLLRGIRVGEKPVRLLLDGRAPSRAPPGSFHEVMILERGRPSKHLEEAHLGGVTVRFEH